MSRVGWTLHEMLISLFLMGLVLGLVSHSSLQQLRFYRSAGELVARRVQLGSASAIAASLLRDISPQDGDILVADDSALELRAPIGSAVSCARTTGHITMPAPSKLTGSTLSAFVETLDVGDRVVALFEDSLGATSLKSSIASPPAAGPTCERFPSAGVTWDVPIQQPLEIPAGAALRFSRPFRLSLYRASDSRWYLGAKTWNASAQEFNTIQPIAGPLQAYSSDSSRTGLLFAYSDSTGEALSNPIDVTRIAAITITSRARSSASRATVALRNVK